MNTSVGKVFGFLTLIVLITSLGTVGLGSVQNAWAAPGVNCLLSSTSVPIGGSLTKTCWGTPGLGEAPHTGGVVVVYRTVDDTGALDTTVTLGGGASCSPIVVGGSGGVDGFTDAYLLDNADVVGTQANMYTIPGSTAGPTLPPIAGSQDSISFKFTGPIIISTTSDGVAPPPSLDGASAWVQIGTGAAIPDLTLGAWRFDTCAVDSSGLAGGDNDAFAVLQPVGGTMIPIDFVSVLAAGAFVNPVFTLPMIGAVAGFAGFALLKLRRKKQ